MSTSSTLRPYARSLVRVGEHGGAHRVALRAGASVLVPFLVLFTIGHVEWSIYAAFGAFTAVYGRTAPRRARLGMQAAAAAVLVSTVLLGSLVALLPGREWAVVAIASVWAMVVAHVSDVFRFTPPGPLFAVFGLCAIASVPGSPSSLGAASVVSGASALLAVAIGQAGRVRGLQARGRAAATDARQRPARSRPSAAPSALTPGASTQPSPVRWAHLARYGIAAAAAGSLSTGLGIGHPYWAMVAAIVPLVAVDLPNSLLRGTHRVLGTVVGLVVAWGLLLADPTGISAILLIVGLQVLAELFVVRNYGLALLFVTPLALLMVNLVHPADPTRLIVDRGVETLLGTLVALAVACGSVLVFRRPLVRAERLT
ncbi:FUSC family protein [Subtercola boreus]|uniref:Integral membrane bound transporter domain-containing protein n=1 Tax=Subtercola boreus TaxID=120213 RepID=A0A3E0W9H0_9MICO|nr:FUSC family protein [Subtercola boreus]RFA20328.1 hypothetical protein B7R24_10020 [Subtercola boreus]RFA20481.1 hypothetical protein B7R23_09955 [Subtercola boreus]RFA26731.1 hypothetical protein B7R25_10085 [Subtercola boreus]